MALKTYDDLKAAVAKWLNRKDLTEVIPDFIRLTEAELNRALDTRQMVETIDTAISGEDYFLPCDFGGVRSLRLNGCNGGKPLGYVTPADLDESFGTGRPRRFTITDRLVFDPKPDGIYDARLRYRKLIKPLGEGCRCNWVLDSHPDAYLAGAVMNGFLYLEDDARASTWASKFQAAIRDINDADKMQSFPVKLNARGRAF